MPKSTIGKLISKKEKLFYFCKVANHFPLWWNTEVQRECCSRENEKTIINLAGRKTQKVSKKYLSIFKIILKEIILLFVSHCATTPKSLES